MCGCLSLAAGTFSLITRKWEITVSKFVQELPCQKLLRVSCPSGWAGFPFKNGLTNPRLKQTSLVITNTRKCQFMLHSDAVDDNEATVGLRKQPRYSYQRRF